MTDCIEALLVLVLLCRNEMEEMGRLYYQLYSRYMLHSNVLTQWAKIKKSVLVDGSMFIAKRIEMNLLHILNLELTKLKLLPIKTTLHTVRLFVVVVRG